MRVVLVETIDEQVDEDYLLRLGCVHQDGHLVYIDAHNGFTVTFEVREESLKTLIFCIHDNYTIPWLIHQGRHHISQFIKKKGYMAAYRKLGK